MPLPLTAESPITAQQRDFADRVIEGSTYADAARAIGWAGNQVAARGSRLAALPHVKAYIAAGKAKLAAKVEEEMVINRVHLLRPLMRIIDREAGEKEPMAQDVDEDTGVAVLKPARDARLVPAARLVAEMQGWIGPNAIISGLAAGTSGRIEICWGDEESAPRIEKRQVRVEQAKAQAAEADEQRPIEIE